MRCTAIIQARMRSTRLPGKVLLPLAGRPALERLIQRVHAARAVDSIIVATTVNPADDQLAAFCCDMGMRVVRGSEDDVLSRFHIAALADGAEIIVRVTADDPMKDPVIIDRTVELLFETGAHVATTSFPPTFPEGLDVEVFTWQALDTAQNASRDSYEREHVTQYFYRHQDLFNIAVLSHSPDLSGVRLTVDTPEDYALAQTIYDALYQAGHLFLMEDVLQFLRSRPEIRKLNRNTPRSDMYRKRNDAENING